MAITVYSGLMGSGKSYEVVSEVITRAIREGRRVITNIDAIDSEKMREYVAEKWKVEDVSTLGFIVHCKNTDILHQDESGKDVWNTKFFYYGDDKVETFVKPGDLVCLDEAWRFFGGGKKIPVNYQIFFREHRHYVSDATKVSCDLVLMVQHISDLHRLLKVVVEKTFVTAKLKKLGSEKKYKIEMYEGHTISKKLMLLREFRQYNPEIFPLYGSYVGGVGVEKKVDRRGSIFTKKFYIIAFFIAVGMILGAWKLWGFFHGDMLKSKDAKKPHTTTAQKKTQTNPVSTPLSSEKISPLKYVGVYHSSEGVFYLVKNEEGVIRSINRDALHRLGPISWLEVDGAKVYMYLGSSRGNSSPKSLSPR